MLRLVPTQPRPLAEQLAAVEQRTVVAGQLVAAVLVVTERPNRLQRVQLDVEQHAAAVPAGADQLAEHSAAVQRTIAVVPLVAALRTAAVEQRFVAQLAAEPRMVVVEQLVAEPRIAAVGQLVAEPRMVAVEQLVAEQRIAVVQHFAEQRSAGQRTVAAEQQTAVEPVLAPRFAALAVHHTFAAVAVVQHRRTQYKLQLLVQYHRRQTDQPEEPPPGHHSDTASSHLLGHPQLCEQLHGCEWFLESNPYGLGTHTG